MTEIFGTDKMTDLIAKPVFWIMIIGVIALLVVIVFSIKHPAGGKYVLFTILGVAILGVTAYSGIQLNYYYSASGGIYGAITGIFETNEIEVISKASYRIKNTELTQVYETNTYSATISFSEVFELSKDYKYMIYVNDMPCNDVHNASDYITGKYTYTFYDEEMKALHTDTLTIKFAFYENSTYLSISTDGGAESVKYWNYYFAKNSFVISLDKATYSKPTQIGSGTGDISNYCIVSYLVDGENVGNQVYLPNSELSLMTYAGKTYGWTYNDSPITDGYVVTSNMIISAESLPLHTINFVYNDEVYSSQSVYDGDLIDASLITSPETIMKEDGEYIVFDFWSIDGSTEYDLTRYPVNSDMTITGVSHKEFDVDFLVDGSLYRSLKIRQGDAVLDVKNPATRYQSGVGYLIFDYWSLDGENEIEVTQYPINSYTKFHAVFHYDFEVVFMFNGEEYASQRITDGSYAEEVEDPSEVYLGDDTYLVFDGWSVDGTNIVNIPEYKLRETTTFYAVTHLEYNITQLFYCKDTGAGSGRVYRCKVGDYIEFTEEENFVIDYRAIGSVDGERLTGDGYYVQDNRDIYVVGDYYYDVTFMIDETSYNTIQVMRGHYAEFSTIPEKENYEFLGWSLDGNNVLDLSEQRIYKNTIFIAVFEDATQHLYLDYNDGSESEVWVRTGKCGDVITLPTPTSLNGETFIGWCFTGGAGVLDAENMTFTLGQGDGYIHALFDVCDVTIDCSKLGFNLTYNGETTTYGSSSSGGSSGGGVMPLAYIVDMGCRATISTNYNDTIQLSGTGVQFWLSSIDCDGQYETSWNDKVLIITYTNCNYINIYVGGNNVSYV